MLLLAEQEDHLKPALENKLKHETKDLGRELQLLAKFIDTELMGVMLLIRKSILESFRDLDNQRDINVRKSAVSAARHLFKMLDKPFGYHPEKHENEDTLYAEYMKVLKKMVELSQEPEEKRKSKLEEINELNAKIQETMTKLRPHLDPDFYFRIDLARNKTLGPFTHLQKDKYREHRDIMAMEAQEYFDKMPSTIPNEDKKTGPA